MQQGAAQAITGSYYITNVGTGKALTYDVRRPHSSVAAPRRGATLWRGGACGWQRLSTDCPSLRSLPSRLPRSPTPSFVRRFQPDGNDLYPASGNGDAVTLTAYGSNVAWVRMGAPLSDTPPNARPSPTNPFFFAPAGLGAKNKCVSAQWGDIGDTAAVMYACQVGPGGSTTSGSTLEPTKQWWIFVPVDGVDDSDSSWGDAQVTLLAKAQKQSVAVRTAANSKRALARHRRARGFGHDEHMMVERSAAFEVDMSEAAIERRSTSAAKKRAAAKAKAAAKSKSIVSCLPARPLTLEWRLS